MSKKYNVGGVYVNAEIDKKGYEKSTKAFEKQTIKTGNKAASGMKSAMGKIGAAAAAAFSVKAIINFAKESEKLYRVQREALIKQAQLMKNAGYKKEDIEGMRAYASELQKVTNYGDEFILNIIGNLSKARLETDQLKRATELTLDTLAAGQTIDLARIMEKPIEMSQTLRRQGILLNQELMRTMTLEEQRAYVLDEVEKKYGGVAQAMSDANTRMKNAFGDLKEEVGRVVFAIKEGFSAEALSVIESTTEKVQALVTGDGVNKIASIFATIGAALQTIFDLVKGTAFKPFELLFELFVTLKDTVQDVMGNLGIVIGEFDVMGRVIAAINLPLQLLFSGYEIIIVTIGSLIPQIKAFGDIFVLVVKININTIKGFIKGLGSISTIFQKIGVSVMKAGELIKNAFDFKTLFTDPEKYKQNMNTMFTNLVTSVVDVGAEIKEVTNGIITDINKSNEELNAELGLAVKNAASITLDEVIKTVAKLDEEAGKIAEQMALIINGDPNSTDYKATYDRIFANIKQALIDSGLQDGILGSGEDGKGPKKKKAKETGQEIAAGFLSSATASSNKAKLGKEWAETFMRAISKGNIFEAIITIIMKFVEKLADFVNIFETSFEFIGSLFEGLMSILALVIKPLEVLLAPIQMLSWVLNLLTSAIKPVLDIIGWMTSLMTAWLPANQTSSFERQKERDQRQLDLLETQIDMLQKQIDSMESVQDFLKKANSISDRLLAIEEEREKRQLKTGLTSQAYTQLVESLAPTGAVTAGFDTSQFLSIFDELGGIDYEAASDLLYLMQFPDLLSAQFLNEEAFSQLQGYLSNLVNYAGEEQSAQQETQQLIDQYAELQQELNIAILDGTVNLADFDSTIQGAIQTILAWNSEMSTIDAPKIPNINTATLQSSLDLLGQKIAQITKMQAGYTGQAAQLQEQLNIRQDYQDWLESKGRQKWDKTPWHRKGWSGYKKLANNKADFARKWAGTVYNKKDYQESYLSSIGIPTSDYGKYKFATGGFVSGASGVDRITARISDGEFVVNPSATAMNRELLEKINSGTIADRVNINTVNVLANDPLDFFDKMQDYLYANRSINITTRGI